MTLFTFSQMCRDTQFFNIAFHTVAATKDISKQKRRRTNSDQALAHPNLRNSSHARPMQVSAQVATSYGEYRGWRQMFHGEYGTKDPIKIS